MKLASIAETQRSLCNTRACGYYGYGSDGKRRYKLTGKTSVMSTNARNVVMDFSFGEYVLYPNSFLTGTAKGYTKHYYAGSERVASRVVERWFVNAKADSLHSVEEHHIKDALQMSNWQFDFTLGERPSYMNSYMPDSVSDIMGNTMQNKVRFPVLALAGYFKRESLVGEACEDLRGREGANGLFFTHSDHLGSSSWTTDADGRAVQHTEYLPFGEELLNQRATFYSERYTFTGKELDEESNLYYYDARYNSSTYSQFTTVDPMSDKYPSVNPYLYCAGNPVMYIDPDGRDWFQSEDNKAVFWNKSTDETILFEGEKYHNIGSNYVEKGDGYTLIYEQNQPTTLVMNALEQSDFETQISNDGKLKQGEQGNCFYNAGLMVQHSGNYSLNGERNNIIDFNEQVKYITEQVSLGFSVRAHVDKTNDGKGDHWVAISYVAINISTQNVISIGFYDPGTHFKFKGVNNHFTINGGCIKGQTSYTNKYLYTVTAIRRNKF